MKYFRWLMLIPYGVFLVVVLVPVGLAFYATAAVAGTIYGNLCDGWKEHR